MRGLWAISGLKVKLRGHSSYVLIGTLRGVGGEWGGGLNNLNALLAPHHTKTIMRNLQNSKMGKFQNLCIVWRACMFASPAAGKEVN